MSPFIESIGSSLSPDDVAEAVRREPGLVILGGAAAVRAGSRHSLVAVRPVVWFEALGPRVRTRLSGGLWTIQFGDPWAGLSAWMDRFEVAGARDWPMPLGACIGFWGYGLNRWVEPRLPRRANDLGLPDCAVGFYSSLVVWDHALNNAWIVATGLGPDGVRRRSAARDELDWWRGCLDRARQAPRPESTFYDCHGGARGDLSGREAYLESVRRALTFIGRGDIYQVNLARRLSAACPGGGWAMHRALSEASPAPFAAFIDAGPWQIASASPELFLRLSGRHALTRPIKGTRPRGSNDAADESLARELALSEKERAELVMIVDLLRNDLGRICEYGSVRAPDLGRTESFAQVHHRVATIEGRLRDRVSHIDALRHCFPGGSVTGAPKIRAMEIIDQLEREARGAYCGAVGYLGFNSESQLAVAIRTAVVHRSRCWYHAGAGIVADSDPEAEFAETEAKAAGWRNALASLNVPSLRSGRAAPAR